MPILTYTVSHFLPGLHDELIAAGLNPRSVSESTDGATVILAFDTSAPDAAGAASEAASLTSAANAVVAAHNPVTSQAAHDAPVQEALAARSDFVTNYQTAITRLNDIVTNGGTYTAAQVRTAVIDEARVILRLLRLTKDLLT